MIDLQDKNHPPILEEIGEYIRNPLFHGFCLELRETFQCRENRIQLVQLGAGLEYQIQKIR